MALTQIVTTDSVSASVVNAKIVDPANTAISGLQIAQTAGGTATAITLTGVELTNGYQKTFIISASNSGSATTVNGKPLYKPGGTVAPNLVAGKSASIWYNLAGDCFFYKASAEGTATAGDVLAGVTFSNDNDAGISGTLSLTGNALTSDVLSGKTFYNDDAKTKLTGTYSNISSIQSGTVAWTESTSTRDITISSIDTSKAVVIISVSTGGESIFLTNISIKASITNATTINFLRNSDTIPVSLNWTVVEFNGVKSKQTGYKNFTASATQQNVTVSSVNASKSLLFFNYSKTGSSTSAGQYITGGRIVSNTSISFISFNSAQETQVHWQLIEFY